MKIPNLKSKITVTAVLLAYVVVCYLAQIPCPILAITGIPCPGCGMTRAFFSAARLDFIGAFRYHTMFWSVPLLYLCFLFDGRLFPKRWLNILFYLIIFAGFILNWAKNIIIM